MGLVDDLNDASNFAEPSRTRCKVCDLLEELSIEDGLALTTRLNDKKAGHTAISDVLIKNGYQISRSAVSRHRKAEHGIK